jgi:hypothetical protein
MIRLSFSFQVPDRNGWRLLLLLGILWYLSWPTMMAQVIIQGRVSGPKGKPVSFANVFIEGVYDGGASDENGHFSFATTAEGKAWLVARSIGFEPHRQQISLSGDSLSFRISLQPANSTLNEIVITAGAFEAGDKKKSAVLEPLDIVTNAGSQGDIYQALETLPGVSQVGDQTGIFVRGGEASETQTFINGMRVQRPFFSSVPDIPGRGRFDPFAFKGTLFATGGYSAEYGQALSSVILLETEDLPDETSTGLSLNMAGVNLSHTHLWNKKTALLVNGGYTNLLPLMSIVPQNRDWVVPPTGGEGSLGFLQKTRGGIFKSYVQYQQSRIGMRFPDLDRPEQSLDFSNQNQNLFINNSYRGILRDRWSFFGGLSLGWDTDKTQMESDRFGVDGLLGQARLTLGREIGRKLFLKFGGEAQLLNESHRRNDEEALIKGWYAAAFGEADLNLGKNWALRLGLRTEYDKLVEAFNVAPRASLAYKTGKFSQLSLAFGQFYQRPESEWLRWGQPLTFERSSHFLANYQWMNPHYTFRVEAYWKPYQNLVRFLPNQTLDNQGGGYARGIDLFWRDRKTIQGLDYWITYSFLDTRREYRDFPQEATPDFITPHTFNVVANYRFKVISLRLGLSYTFASGRTYFNPNADAFLEDTAPAYHNLNLNASYLTHIKGHFTVLYASVRNPFGFNQVFSYRYSEDGRIRRPVVPASDWSFFLGMFVSFEN